MTNNLNKAKNYLFDAIQYKNSEEPINQYIKFMDTLSEEDRNFILLNDGIKCLIDKINGG